MNAIGTRIQVWPSRELRRQAHAACLDPDQVAAVIRWRAGKPQPGDDAARWDRAFLEALKAEPNAIEEG